MTSPWQSTDTPDMQPGAFEFVLRDSPRHRDKRLVVRRTALAGSNTRTATASGRPPMMFVPPPSGMNSSVLDDARDGDPAGHALTAGLCPQRQRHDIDKCQFSEKFLERLQERFHMCFPASCERLFKCRPHRSRRTARDTARRAGTLNARPRPARCRPATCTTSSIAEAITEHSPDRSFHRPAVRVDVDDRPLVLLPDHLVDRSHRTPDGHVEAQDGRRQGKIAPEQLLHEETPGRTAVRVPGQDGVSGGTRAPRS